jgi:hypothetical protein
MLKSFVAGIGIFLAGIFGAHQASAPPLPSASTVSIAAAAATALTSIDPQQPTTTQSTNDPTRAQIAPAVSTPSGPDLSAYVTKAELDARLSGLSAFGNSLQQLVHRFSNAAPVSAPGPFAPLTVAAFAPSQRIDNLSNVTISNATVSGVSGLTSSDIPDLSGKYLSLGGRGTLTGTSTGPFVDAGGAVYNVKAYGAKGDGTTDDTAAINLAVTAAYNAGGGTVVFSPGAYVLKRRIVGQQQIGGIWLLSGVNFEGNGAKLLLRDNTEFFMGTGLGSSPISSVVTTDITASTTQVTVANGTLFAAGNTVFYRLGQDSGDSAESTYFGFAKIASISGNILTFDRTINPNLTVSAVSNSANRSIYLISNPLENIHIDNFFFYNDIPNGGNAESGVSVTYAQGVTISNIRAKDPGAGVVTTQYADNINIENINVDSSIAQNGQASKGRAFDFAESTNVHVENVAAANLQGVFDFNEFYSRNITIHNLDLVNTLPESSSSNIFAVNQDSSVDVENMKISGNGNFNLYSTGGGLGRLSVRNLELNLDSQPYSLAVPGIGMTGTFRMIVGTSTDETYNLDNGHWVQRTINLQNGQNGSLYYLPPGITGAIYIYVPSTITPNIDLPSLYVGRQSDNGSNVSAYLVSGQEVQLGGSSTGAGAVQGALWNYRGQNLKLNVTTAASGMAGKYLIVRALIFPQTTQNASYSDNTQALSDAGGGMVFSSTTPGTLPFFSDPNTLGATSLYWNGANSWLGVGVAPSYALDVNGFVNVAGTAGGYKQAGNTILYASSANFSTLVGNGTGVNLLSTALYNTALGYQALGNATSSQYNVAIGYQALKGNSTISNGGPNLAIGYKTLFSNTAGVGNISLSAGGDFAQSLFSNTTGSNNVAIGTNGTLYSNTSGHDNIGVGGSMYWNQSGSYNIGIGNSTLGGSSGNSFSYNEAIGHGALGHIVSGGDDIGIGYFSLPNTTTGDQNVGIGSYAMQSNITGSGNVAIGGQNGGLGILNYNTSATNTVAIGFLAGRGTSSYYNQGGTLLGYQTGLSFQTGSDYNTLLGYSAGNLITTGWGNILIGAASTTANDNLTTGSGNIKIGNNIALPSATTNYQLDIGNLIYGTGLSGTGATVSSGNIGIGTTTPYSRLTVWGPDTASTTSAFVVANSASTTEFAVYDTGNAVLAGGLTQNSDIRLKTNIQPLNASSSLAAIVALNPVTFKWVDPAKGLEPHLGFIAQQVLPIFPNLVSTTSPTSLTPDGTLGLNYIDLISPIVAAIQELYRQLTNLANTVAGFADHFTTKDLTFTRATGDELCLKKSDGTNVCVTGDQLAAVLASQGSSGSSSPSSNSASSSPSPDTEAPVITIDGENPAHIHVGDSYADLGVSVTDNVDQNLGLKYFLNSTLVSNIVIDTSAPATDTIDYVATDSAGNTATSTRTVIISPAVQADTASATTQ